MEKNGSDPKERERERPARARQRQERYQQYLLYFKIKMMHREKVGNGWTKLFSISWVGPIVFSTQTQTLPSTQVKQNIVEETEHSQGRI